jgi:hypothetical protein
MRLLLLTLLIGAGNCFAANMSDEQVKQAIVDQSISQQKEPCPCPYSKHPDGRQCGKRSAYHKLKEDRPICYTINVTSQQVDDYRAKHPN